MAMTVKQLIAKLQEMPNKYAEVEILVGGHSDYSKELDDKINIITGKVLLNLKLPPKY